MGDNVVNTTAATQTLQALLHVASETGMCSTLADHPAYAEALLVATHQLLTQDLCTDQPSHCSTAIQAAANAATVAPGPALTLARSTLDIAASNSTQLQAEGAAACITLITCEPVATEWLATLQAHLSRLPQGPVSSSWHNELLGAALKLAGARASDALSLSNLAMLLTSAELSAAHVGAEQLTGCIHLGLGMASNLPEGVQITLHAANLADRQGTLLQVVHHLNTEQQVQLATALVDARQWDLALLVSRVQSVIEHVLEAAAQQALPAEVLMTVLNKARLGAQELSWCIRLWLAAPNGVQLAVHAAILAGQRGQLSDVVHHLTAEKRARLATALVDAHQWELSLVASRDPQVLEHLLQVAAYPDLPPVVMTQALNIAYEANKPALAVALLEQHVLADDSQTGQALLAVVGHDSGLTNLCKLLLGRGRASAAGHSTTRQQRNKEQERHEALVLKVVQRVVQGNTRLSDSTWSAVVDSFADSASTPARLATQRACTEHLGNLLHVCRLAASKTWEASAYTWHLKAAARLAGMPDCGPLAVACLQVCGSCHMASLQVQTCVHTSQGITYTAALNLKCVYIYWQVCQGNFHTSQHACLPVVPLTPRSPFLTGQVTLYSHLSNSNAGPGCL
jgi:hypothetical protein